MRFLPTNQIWRYWSFDTCLRDIEATGANDIDLWLCNNHVNIDAHDIYNAKAVVDGLKKHRVRVRTLTPEQGNPKAYNIMSSDCHIKRLTEGYYRQIVRLAGMLDCSRISINGGWFSLDEDPSKAWDNMVSSIGLICDIAGERGIDVCLETLTPKRYRLLTNPASMMRALSDIDRPNLQVTLDTGTIARAGENLEDYLEQFETNIGYVHLTNLDPSVFAHLAWGDEYGVLNATDIVNSLSRHGFDGDCALEMTCPSYFNNPREVLARALSVLKGCER